MDRAGPAVGIVGTTVSFDVMAAAEIVLQVALAHRPGGTVHDRLEVLNNDTPLSLAEVPGPVGGREHLIRAEPGVVTVTYGATLSPTAAPAPAAVTPAERILALRPSRYCPSDRLVGFASRHFQHPDPAERVRAICDYVHANIAYVTGTSDHNTDAADTLLAGHGVCRDFAHLVATLCRAVEVPARIAAVYAPGLWPMDLHAVVETDIEGAWHVWDATRLAPRPSLLRIGSGRDAADIALAAVISGRADLTSLYVQALTDRDLPVDDHKSLAVLP